MVFDAGQNSVANFAHLAATGLHFVGSVPPSDCPELLALPATDRHTVDEHRFPGLTACDTRREVYDADRRVVLTHSATLHTAQSRGFDQTLAKATGKLAALADTLARGRTRRPRAKVDTEITTILKDPWAARAIDYQLTGDTPPEHRLSFHIDDQARAELETQQFGKRVLITDRDDWPVAEVGPLPLPIRGRVLLPATQRPPRSVVLPDVPLDRPQHRRAHLHLRAGPATGPPPAPESPPRRPRPVRQSPPGHPQRNRRNRADLPPPPEDAPRPAGCSPRPPPNKTNSPRSSTSPGART